MLLALRVVAQCRTRGGMLAECRHPQRRLAWLTREAERRVQMALAFAIGQQHAARLDVRMSHRIAIAEHRQRGNAEVLQPPEPGVACAV
jgi:hypothetical protein